MAGRNRMNYGRDSINAQYQGCSYGNAAPLQLGPLRDTGMGCRDSSGVRRGLDQEPHLSRRSSGPPYPTADPRDFSERGISGVVGDGRVNSGGRGGLSLLVTEPPMLSSQQMLNAGVNRLPHEQGGLIGAGGVSPHLHPVPMRGVHNYRSVDSYGSLQQQQVQLADGSLRTMYSVPELGGNLPADVGLGAFRGGYVGSEEANLTLAAAQAQKLQQQGIFQGRQIMRDGRLIHMEGWEADGPVAPPLSPRTMPMSPRRDDVVRLMSPRREELSPIPMSPRRDDMSRMMSPRRDDMSSPRSPRRRGYPTFLNYGGRVPQRRGFSPSREDDFLYHPKLDFPASPRRGAPLTPPREISLRRGWGYEGHPVSPRRLTAPISPRRDTPPRSPIWGRIRQSTKAPSQWDVLPGNTNSWNGGNDSQTRRGSRYDHSRALDRNVGYGADLDDSKRLGQGWSASRKGEGRYGRGEHDMRCRVSGRSYGDQPQPRYASTSSRQNAYNSVVNQRVGMTTKYIEKERAQKAAERVAKDAADKTPKETSRKRPAEDERRSTDSSKSFHADHRNEKDTLAAAIAKTTANNSNHVSNNGKKTSRHEGTTVPATSSGKSAPATATTNLDRSGGGETTTVSKPSAATVAGTSAPADGIADSKNTEVVKAESEDSLKKNMHGNSENNSGCQRNGPSDMPGKGKVTTDTKPGGVQLREASSNRPSLVMEIERAKKSRKIAEQQRHANIQEVEETYYDANELSTDFVTKMNRAGSRYSQMINDDHLLKERYQGGGQGGLHCLVCGKGSKTFSDIYELVTHAQHSQVQSKRIDHMGFRKALIDALKLDIKDPPINNSETEEDLIVWPPVVVVENTRTGHGADKRWEGVTNSEMALLLNELGHLHGRAKSIWDKFGHKGIVHVEFESTLEGLQEAERLHNYFLQNGRGRVQWDIIRPFKTGLPGCEAVPEGPDFSRHDEVTKTRRRVLYGYVALKKDVDKIFSKKQRKKVQVINRKEVKASVWHGSLENK